MTPMDFIISIIPYQHKNEVEDLKKKKKKFKTKCESSIEFFKLADTDGDGLISFEEYLFFLSLISTPPSYFQIAFKMFDIDKSGFIDLNEFQQIIMKTSNNAVTARQGKRERAQVSKVFCFLFFVFCFLFLKERKRGIQTNNKDFKIRSSQPTIW